MRTHQEVISISIPGCEADIAVSLIVLDRSLIVHLGDSQSVPAMPQLALSMPSCVGTGLPVSTCLFDETDSGGDDFSESLSRRIAQKCQVQCFVSENLPGDWKHEELLMKVMEKRLLALIQEKLR